MELSIVAPGKSVAGTVNVSDTAFAREYNEDLVHQVVTAYLAGGRQGTKAQKTRATVSGGGKKPWKQKGSGRARAGSNTSPVWVGGGRAFAAQPRNHSQKVNRKMYRAGMSAILSELARQKRLVVVDTFLLDQPKTKLLKERLTALGAPEALVVTDEIDTNLYLAGRNIPKVDVRDVQATDPVSLVSFDKVIVTVAALKKFEEMLG